MFNKTRCALPALALQGIFTLGAWLSLCLDHEIPMYACGILAVALTDPKGLMLWKGGES